MKKLVLLAAAVPLLALATACSPSADAKTAADQKPAATRTTAPAGKKDAPPEPGITADQLADYQKVAACMKQQGVTVPEPVVGKPFDDAEMNRLFTDDKDKWDAVLSNCDYKKVVIGVG